MACVKFPAKVRIKAMASRHVRGLEAELARLKKQLQENEELMRKALMKMEDMRGTNQSLRRSLEAIKEANRNPKTNR
jgi:hypothetical protein